MVKDSRNGPGDNHSDSRVESPVPLKNKGKSDAVITVPDALLSRNFRSEFGFKPQMPKEQLKLAIDRVYASNDMALLSDESFLVNIAEEARELTRQVQKHGAGRNGHRPLIVENRIEELKAAIAVALDDTLGDDQANQKRRKFTKEEVQAIQEIIVFGSVDKGALNRNQNKGHEYKGDMGKALARARSGDNPGETQNNADGDVGYDEITRPTIPYENPGQNGPNGAAPGPRGGVRRAG